MRLSNALVLGLVGASLTSFAFAGEYGRASAKIKTDKASFVASHSLKRPVVLLSRSDGGALGTGVVRELTLGAVNINAAYEVWETAATQLISPLGCKVDKIYPVNQRWSWEFTYTCPEGVDLRAEMTRQRPQTWRGEPLRADSPPIAAVSPKP